MGRVAPFIVSAVLALATTAAAVTVAVTGAGAENRRDAGRKISERHCSRCHVVGDFDPYGGIGSTPSFRLLAKRSDWLERFQTFYRRRPHPVFVRVPGVPPLTELPAHVKEFRITAQEIADLIVFVETLRPR